MLIAMKELFLKRSRRRSAGDGRPGRRLSKAVLRSLECSWPKVRRRRKKTAAIGVPAERLESRLAMTVGAYEAEDTIYVHVDTAESILLKIIFAFNFSCGDWISILCGHNGPDFQFISGSRKHFFDLPLELVVIHVDVAFINRDL